MGGVITLYTGPGANPHKFKSMLMNVRRLKCVRVERGQLLPYIVVFVDRSLFFCPAAGLCLYSSSADVMCQQVNDV